MLAAAFFKYLPHQLLFLKVRGRGGGGMGWRLKFQPLEEPWSHCHQCCLKNTAQPSKYRESISLLVKKD